MVVYSIRKHIDEILFFNAETWKLLFSIKAKPFSIVNEVYPNGKDDLTYEEKLSLLRWNLTIDGGTYDGIVIAHAMTGQEIGKMMDNISHTITTDEFIRQLVVNSVSRMVF